MNKKSAEVPFYKNKKFIYNFLTVVSVVVFICCLIAVNVLGTALSNRFTAFSIDLTSSADYTISDANKEYIKKIDKPVKIIMTCTEDYYLSTYLSTVSQYYSDSSGGKYFKQTIELLKDYQKINSNISVEFIDAGSPDFNEYYDRYSSSSLVYGDIVVDYTYEDKNGKEISKYKVVSFDDIYQISTDSTGSTSGTIAGSDIETSITSALYYVIQENEDKIAVVTGYGCSDVSSYVESLETAGYDYEEISDLELDAIPEDATMILLPAPTIDLSESDVKKIDEFLLGNANDKDFSYGKTLIYFASDSQSEMPNLDGLLEDWGIAFKNGTVYETAVDKTDETHTSIRFELADDAGDFVDENNSNYYYMADDNRPMSLKFDSKSRYNTYNILSTSDTCVVRPYKNSGNWSADNENQSAYSEIALSRFVTGDDGNDAPRFSNILSIASIDFINETSLSVKSNGNDELLLSMINTCAGRVEGTYDIETRMIDYTKFEPTEIQTETVKIICRYVIPIIVVVMGIVLFVVRKRR